MKVGEVFSHSKYGEYKIIEVLANQQVKIEFYNTKKTKIVSKYNAKIGNVKDKYAPTVSGVGCLGNIMTNEYKREYAIWKSMIERCYRKNHMHYKRYGGRGIKVCDRWLCFENFVEDFKNIEGYTEELYKNPREYHLDKDYKQKDVPFDKMVYSLKTCCFIPQKINNQHISRTTCFIARKDNEIFISNNIHEWCRSTGHIIQCVTRVIANKQSHHRGWEFDKITIEDYYKFEKQGIKQYKGDRY